MVRTQIQLTKSQAERLKRLAASNGVSMAELVRQGVDRVLEAAPASTRGDTMRRAMRDFGAFRSGSSDLATRHDEAFAAAVAPRVTARPASPGPGATARPAAHAPRARRLARRS
jgi:predicted nuclease with RNAse H fold